MRSSPFLAVRVLNRLPNVEEAKHPAAARLLRSYVYTEDILGGMHTETEAKQNVPITDTSFNRLSVRLVLVETAAHDRAVQGRAELEQCPAVVGPCA
ncbi:hypothetical protein EVAR_23961_1 [Eumeta japonica]|uniref:Uncharacterized protein n=1 Tax=Eumeta variegata TaxID=151549 RepID=A0A4C1V206_EUMVA|nr:hypothetical protein EVAR_23961_1 [Eumeta japonica]